MTTLLRAAAAIALLASGLPAGELPTPRTWYVDDDGGPGGDGSSGNPFASIQRAIDAPQVQSGDKVIVRAGFYLENVDLSGKSLKLIAREGPASTVIDGGGLGSVVRLTNGETPATRITGFTLEGGAGTPAPGNIRRGGAILCIGSSATFRNCTIRDNYVGFGEGHGAYLESGRLTFIGCQIENNGEPLGLGVTEFGGGIFALDSFLSLYSSQVCGNLAGQGGGIEARQSRVILRGVTLSANEAREEHGGGGGLRLEDCETTVERSEITLNDSSFDFRDGGGVKVDGGTARFELCRFRGNRADEGGAAHVSAGDVEFLQCTFEDNHAVDLGGYPDTRGDGGALHVAGGTVRAAASTFIGNSAAGTFGVAHGRGGALYGPAELDHCTVHSNWARESGGGVFGGRLSHSIVWRNVPDAVDATTTAHYSDIQGGHPGQGNLDLCPLFWDAAGREFHLLPYSPCVDAGDPTAPLDADGSNPDLGAFPFEPGYCPAATVYCDAKVNSLGCMPSIEAQGSVRLNESDTLCVKAAGVLNNQVGILFWGTADQALPAFGGTLRVAPPVRLMNAQPTGGNPGPDDCSGTLEFEFSGAYLSGQGIGPFSALYAQYWYRDPRFQAPNDVGLTAAVRFYVCP